MMKCKLTAYLLALCLLLSLFAGCGGAENRTEALSSVPGEEEKASSSVDKEAPLFTPCAGHIVIGKLYEADGFIGEKVLSDYCLNEGSTIEIKEYGSDRKLIEAARAGEIDVIFGNNLVAYLLAHEDRLMDLDPYLSELFKAEDYYMNIIDAGRIGERLVMVCPNFWLGDALGFPEKAVEAFGQEPRDLGDVLALYRTLEEDYRADGVMLETSLGVFDAALHLEDHSFDIAPLWSDWTALLSAEEKDAVENRLYDDDEATVYHALMSDMGGSFFADPTLIYDYYRLLSGEVYTRFESKAVLVPFSFENAEGFTIKGGTYAIPEAAPHPEAALSLVKWIMSPEGQESSMQENCSCPIYKSEAQKWFLRRRSYRENMYTPAEQQEIAEAYIARADRYPALSGVLRRSMVHLLNEMGNEERRADFIEIMTSTEIDPALGGAEYRENVMKQTEGYAYLMDYVGERMASMDETVPFYDDRAAENWQTLINDYIRGYIADLGYEMH